MLLNTTTVFVRRESAALAPIEEFVSKLNLSGQESEELVWDIVLLANQYFTDCPEKIVPEKFDTDCCVSPSGLPGFTVTSRENFCESVRFELAIYVDPLMNESASILNDWRVCEG